MESTCYSTPQIQKEDILQEIMIINNCISESKSILTRIKNIERLNLKAINKKKKIILKNDS